MLWTNTWKAADWLLRKHSRNSRIILLRSILHRSGFYIFKQLRAQPGYRQGDGKENEKTTIWNCSDNDYADCGHWLRRGIS